MRLSQKTASVAFDRAVAAVAGTATHTVTRGPEGMPASAYAELRAKADERTLPVTARCLESIIRLSTALAIQCDLEDRPTSERTEAR